MSLKKVVKNGKLEFVKGRFGRNSKKAQVVNYFSGCTYIHLRNYENDKRFTLGIDEYEELVEILMDNIDKYDTRFQEEDEDRNTEEDGAAALVKANESENDDDKTDIIEVEEDVVSEEKDDDTDTDKSDLEMMHSGKRKRTQGKKTTLKQTTLKQLIEKNKMKRL